MRTALGQVVGLGPGPALVRGWGPVLPPPAPQLRADETAQVCEVRRRPRLCTLLEVRGQWGLENSWAGLMPFQPLRWYRPLALLLAVLLAVGCMLTL